MEDAGLSVESGPPDQLDQGFQLDLKGTAELEDFDAEGFDFGLDGSHEEFEHDLVEGNPDDAGEQAEESFVGEVPDDAAAEPELDLTVSEVQPASPGGEQTQNTENAEDVTEDNSDYQDEIGYEDDDHPATDVNADLSITEGGEAKNQLPGTPPKEDLEATLQADDSHLEVSTQEHGVSGDQDTQPEEHAESSQQGLLGDINDAEASEHQEGSDLAVADELTPGQPNTDRHNVDLEEELESLVQSISEIPDIEVLYNQECYSLFGTADDDPDSYFLSDVKDLDRPLSQFLSALRAVISDEISSTDELLVRFDPLDLEFGERSNSKFLNRSFREILDCHSTLRRVPGVTKDPVILLTVRRDSEEHFLEILADAERVKDSPSNAEDSEMSEDLDEGSRTNALDDGQAQDEPFENANSEDYHNEGGDNIANHVMDSGQFEVESTLGHEEATEEHEHEHVPQSPDTAREVLDVKEYLEDAPGEEILGLEKHPEDVPGEEFLDTEGHIKEHLGDATGEETLGSEGQFENASGDETLDTKEHFEDVGESHAHESSERGTDEGQDWDEQEVASNAAQHLEASPEATDKHGHYTAEQPDGDGHTNAPDSGVINEAGSPEDGVSEHEADSNDNDIILAFDDEPNPSAVGEEPDQDDEYAISYDAVEDTLDNAEHAQELDTVTSSDRSAGKHLEFESPAIVVAETASVHTSTTINGDEIDYDEEEPADDAFATGDDGAQQSLTASGIDRDEIDWENDEDEYEDQSANYDAGVGNEQSKEDGLTSPGVAGKRGRTDEEESLADETDYKRRRT
ncbi:hypothetical protein C7999DRAFT_27350 [Corynascus novoguineensis]|uniref:Uncharacterized protein n=1 Tax=Corynascus novoguineensis TaxID=1126955 RepID=A0AAN7HV46_9PEZI|nr:hypothetical protein C7999DRAFT_27350 [Corynascus novoguineensis]